MRLRATLVAGALVAGLAVAGAVAWPLLSQRIVAEVESRLSRETGRTWRVAGGIGAGLSPMPYVTLRDIATKDEPGGYSAAIRELRLSGAFALLLDASAGSVHAVIDDLRLRLPVNGALRLSGTKPGRALDGIKAVKIALEGADAALADADTVLVLTLARADAAIDLGANAGRTAIRAGFDGRDYAAAMELDLAASGSSPLRLSVTPRAGGHTLAAGATAVQLPGGLKLDGVTGTFDGEPFSGFVSVEDGGARPRLGLDLRLKALALTDADAAAGSRPRSGGAGLVVPVRTDIVPDPKWFATFDAAAALSVGRLAVGPMSVEGVAAKIAVKDGSLDAAFTAESVYEGGARARYVLAPAGKGDALHQVSLSLTNIRAAPLLSDLAGVRAIDGTGTARIDVQAQGLSLDAILKGAKGAADIRLANGRIDGLDVASLAGLIPLDNASGERASGLVTAFSSLGGSFRVADGKAVTDDLALKTNLLEAKGAGSIDLVGRSLDMQLKPTLAVPGRSRPNGRGGLSVPVHVSGPWTGPAVSADFSGVMNDPQGALGALQELGGSILGGQGLGGRGSPGQGQGQGNAGPDGDPLGEGGLGGLLDALMGQKPAPRQGRPGAGRP
ncbi:AsmA family protein [Methylobacterium sp. sgz302541]|uniref:AsmA family protein n=1 Tax=unclassified Methylobacterium TaxID=2615210 RepID=UPI003D33C7E2